MFCSINTIIEGIALLLKILSPPGVTYPPQNTTDFNNKLLENAKFGQPEVNLGLIPGIGGTQRLKRSAGKYNANYLCMTGDIISAQQAHNIGFVSAVLKAEEFKEGAMKILKSISEKPLSSLVEIKRLINKDASLKDERQTFYKLLDGENKYIGIKSFFEKTKPEWK